MIKLWLLLFDLGQTTEAMAPGKNHCLPSSENIRIPFTSRGSWSPLTNPYSWNLLFSFITSTVPLQAIILSLLFFSPSPFNYTWHLFFKREIFFSWEITSKFQVQEKKKKAALESERIIIASGMEDRRKCQIKELNFKRQQHSDRKRRRWKQGASDQ